MTVNDPSDRATGGSEHQHRGVARENRGADFSDSQWEEGRGAAQDLGIWTGALVPLIGRTLRRAFWYTHILSTKMLDKGKREDLDHLVGEARMLQTSLLKSTSG